MSLQPSALPSGQLLGLAATVQRSVAASSSASAGARSLRNGGVAECGQRLEPLATTSRQGRAVVAAAVGTALPLAMCHGRRKARRRQQERSVLRRSTSPGATASAGSQKDCSEQKEKEDQEEQQTMGWRPDQFLQKRFNGGVILSGILSGTSKSSWPQLPPGSGDEQGLLPALALVPARSQEAGGGSLSLSKVTTGGGSCVPFEATDSAAAEVIRRRLRSGPLLPETACGKALQHVLQVRPDNFHVARDYELLRSAFGGRPGDIAGSAEEEAEILLLSAYARYVDYAEAPVRPSAGASKEDYSMYTRLFSTAAMKALEATMSTDFQLIGKAHVLGLAQKASFPNLTATEARALYSNAMSFGFALRQAEVRFQADGAAGTFVPVAVETQMLREELETQWAKAAVEPREILSLSSLQAALDGSRGNDSPLGDHATCSEAAQRSLEEVLARLRRLGEVPPEFATYLGWLGKFDPEAMALLAEPPQSVSLAIQKQLAAVWGSDDVDDAALKVTTTPFDMVEALVLGAWLRDTLMWARDAAEMLAHTDRNGAS
eukprot:TRINITY_DN120696_c0_g1_i1.p1 TRINITY_DN120696_c0_g1~~TRINITY_DN120696_c0_g1_i1.p1  ORF type:complete len:548 (-),score=129.64 TRINITY_DN120696_c0_g1_i1:45-1688(-)